MGARSSEYRMNNLEKAAGMLVCMGVEKAAQVFALLSYDEVQLLASQMAHTGRITGGMRKDLLADLRERAQSPSVLLTSGGMEFVHRLLSQTFGDERAQLVLEQLTQRKKGSRPFSVLRTVESHRIIDIISGEHPSVIALVLYYLPREKSAQILAGLVENVRHEVVMRLVNLQAPVPAVVTRLEELLAEKLSDTLAGGDAAERDFGAVTGARALVEMLARVDPGVEKRVYQFLQERDPILAEEVRKSMFVFEDIMRLQQRDVQMVIRELSSQEIALALKGTSDELRNLVLNNVSENSAKTINEELELMGPVRLSQVEEAQQKVVTTVRRLADMGSINLVQAESEELVA